MERHVNRFAAKSLPDVHHRHGAAAASLRDLRVGPSGSIGLRVDQDMCQASSLSGAIAHADAVSERFANRVRETTDILHEHGPPFLV